MRALNAHAVGAVADFEIYAYISVKGQKCLKQSSTGNELPTYYVPTHITQAHKIMEMLGRNFIPRSNKVDFIKINLTLLQ